MYILSLLGIFALIKMKKVIIYILIQAVLLQGVQWHPDEVIQVRTFVSDAIEHLQSGDSFMDFLQKHYGKQEIVNKHLKKSHPDRKKPVKQHQHIENVHIWTFEFPPVIKIKKIKCIHKLGDFYQDPSSCAFFKPLYSPPELI